MCVCVSGGKTQRQKGRNLDRCTVRNPHLRHQTRAAMFFHTHTQKCRKCEKELHVSELDLAVNSEQQCPPHRYNRETHKHTHTNSSSANVCNRKDFCLHPEYKLSMEMTAQKTVSS